jgi:hypothetical protein
MTNPSTSSSDQKGQSSSDNLTVGSMTQLATELIDTWDAKTHASVKRSTLARDVMVFSYAMHAHNLARAYLNLAERGEWMVAYPTLRACYEMGVSAQWVFATPGAVEISLSEAERHRKNLINSALDAQSLSAEEAAERLKQVEKEMKKYEEAKKRGLPTRFEGVCKDFKGPFIYMMYRMLSHYTHAGPAVVDIYTKADEAGNIKEFGDPGDTESEHRGAMHQLCTSLVWAGRAADALGGVRGRRSQLRKAGKFLAIPIHLELDDKAVIRSNRGRHNKSNEKSP